MTVSPGAISVNSGSPVIVGSTPLADSSDSTYVQITADWDGSAFTGFQRVHADFPTATLTSPVVVHMRASVSLTAGAETWGSLLANVALYDRTDFSPFLLVGKDRAVPSPSTTSPDWLLDPGGPTDYAINLSDIVYGGSTDHYAVNGTTEAAVLAMFAAGTASVQLQVDAPNGFPGIYQLTIYELWIDDVVPSSGPLVAPPLRLTNRDDMFSSAPRLVNPSSRQSTNRLTAPL